MEVEPNKRLLVIEVPPPANLLKLDRDLNSRGMRFKKGTVLIRVGQDICVADPMEIEALKRQYQQFIASTPIQPKRVLHNLPRPDYIHFVGRKQELSRLKNLLHPNDRIWCIVIDGIGGIGKSALALETAYYYLREVEQLTDEESFDAIVWVSAKASTLTADGIVNRYRVTSTLNEIYKTIAIVLEEDNILKARFEEQERLVCRILTQWHTLLIIDNFETIDDERVLSFIRELPNPTKCIVTTRHRIDIADPVRLSAMSQDDALALISQECDKKQVDLSEEQANLLYKRTGGVPLAVVWSIAQMSYQGSNIPTVLYQLGNAHGDIARFCFEGSIQLISNKPAQLLLVCLSIFNYGATTRENLGKITHLSNLDRDEALVELEKLSLVNRQGTNFKILPLVKQYVLSTIAEFPLTELKDIVLRITTVYAPAGADAYKAIEPFFSVDDLADLKEQVTTMIIDQSWEWEAQYDDLGVSYCVSALEQLATKPAITNIKHLLGGCPNTPYAEQDAILALGRLGEIEYLIDFLKEGMPYSIASSLDIIEMLGRYGDDDVITVIDQLLQTATDKKTILALRASKEKILERVRS